MYVENFIIAFKDVIERNHDLSHNYHFALNCQLILARIFLNKDFILTLLLFIYSRAVPSDKAILFQPVIYFKNYKKKRKTIFIIDIGLVNKFYNKFRF